MALDKVLLDAARITWRRRSWWVLGLLATSGGLLLSLFLRTAAWSSAGELSLTDLDIERSLQGFANPATLITGVTGAFVLGVAFWLLSAVAEGGLITAVQARTAAEPLSLGRALKAGLGLLGRYVGIDALLFLPLFLLALALMLVGFAGLGALVVVATRPGAQLADLLLVAGVSTVISLPILLLMLLAGAVIMVLRSLAFRAAAMEHMTATASIRRAWRLLRARLFSVAGVALVLWAVRSLVGTPLRMVAMLVAGLGWAVAWTSLGPDTDGLSLLLAAAGVLVAIVTWLVNGLVNVFGSTSWTLSYSEWAAETG